MRPSASSGQWGLGVCTKWFLCQRASVRAGDVCPYIVAKQKDLKRLSEIKYENNEIGALWKNQHDRPTVGWRVFRGGCSILCLVLSEIRSKEEAGGARRDKGCFSKEENANVDINEPRSSYYMRIIPGKELVQNGAVFCINVQPHSSQWRVCFRQVHQMRWLWTCCDCTPDAVGLWCVSGFFRL